MLKPGDRITVTGLAGTVHARVEHAHTLEQLPDLPVPEGRTLAAMARSVLAEMGVDQVAMISYDAGDGSRHNTLVFAAVHLHGQWKDLQGQVLDIQPARPA